MQTSLKLPYPVSVNVYYRSRVIKTKGGYQSMTYVSAEAKAYKQEAGWTARAAGVKPMLGPLSIALTLFPKITKAGIASKVRLDLDNCIKVMLDALNGIAYEDDSQIVEIIARIGQPVQDGGIMVSVSHFVAEQTGLFALETKG